MNNKLTNEEISVIKRRLENKFSYDISELDVDNNYIELLLEGKAYGSGDSGWASYDVVNGELRIDEAEGMSVTDTAEKVLSLVKEFKNVKRIFVSECYD